MIRERIGLHLSWLLAGAALALSGPLMAPAATAVAVTATAAPSASPSPVVSTPSAGTGASPASKSSTATVPIPVFAYFYQWFTATSWNRAKQDFPLIGKYSSDDARVLRIQVQQARAAGLDGFLTSWKDTPALDRRLQLLINVARSEQLDLGVVYEALDFSRKPLPIATVEHDLRYLVAAYGESLRSTYFRRAIVIWTGTDQYSAADVAAVRQALGDRVYLLAASKTVAGYQRVASSVDGEAYYWSSADPTSATTLTKLKAMAAAVHANHGLWIAPAAAGFDGRTLGSSRVIDRDNGQTLVRSLDNAFASARCGVACAVESYRRCSSAIGSTYWSGRPLPSVWNRYTWLAVPASKNRNLAIPSASVGAGHMAAMHQISMSSIDRPTDRAPSAMLERARESTLASRAFDSTTPSAI